MILVINLLVLSLLLIVWANIERKWRTIYISQDPTITYWNHIYVNPKEDASAKIQSAIDFHSRRLGGTARLGRGKYCVENTIELKNRTVLKGE